MRFGEEKKNYFRMVDTDGMIRVHPANPAAITKPAFTLYRDYTGMG